MLNGTLSGVIPFAARVASVTDGVIFNPELSYWQRTCYTCHMSMFPRVRTAGEARSLRHWQSAGQTVFAMWCSATALRNLRHAAAAARSRPFQLGSTAIQGIHAVTNGFRVLRPKAVRIKLGEPLARFETCVKPGVLSTKGNRHAGPQHLGAILEQPVWMTQYMDAYLNGMLVPRFIKDGLNLQV